MEERKKLLIKHSATDKRAKLMLLMLKAKEKKEREERE